MGGQVQALRLSKSQPYVNEKYLIFYIESPAQVFFPIDQQNEKIIHHFDPVYEFIKKHNINIFSPSNLPIKDPDTRPHVIIHSFSNGGINQLWKLHLNLQKRDINMNIRGLIFDSAPSSTVKREVNPLLAFVRGVTLDKAKPGTWEHTLRSGMVYLISTVVIPTYIIQNFFKIRNFLNVNEDTIYDVRFQTIKKLFLYSMGDKLVPWSHVEEHIKRFEEIGLSKIETKRWQDAEHVMLIFADKDGSSFLTQILDKHSRALCVFLLSIVAAHWGSFQSVHNFRFFWYQFYAEKYLANTHKPTRITYSRVNTSGSSKKPEIILKDPFFADVNHFRVWLDDVDYNLHMNNGRYASRVDLSRFQFGAKWFYTGDSDPERVKKGYVATGGTNFFFKKELKPLEKFIVQTRLLTWNAKWMFLEHRFLVRRATNIVRVSGLDSGIELDDTDKSAMDEIDKSVPEGYILACYAVSKLVVKLRNGKTQPMTEVLKTLKYLGEILSQDELDVSDDEYSRIKKLVDEHNAAVEIKRAAGWQIAKRIMLAEEIAL
ncbi:hypothetical protein HK096_001487 [Nowakowskiella sp. JEL0078]|nr:hypothetical protein HK096_001487 [Nowakowskiella sp. JEL0078]